MRRLGDVVSDEFELDLAVPAPVEQPQSQQAVETFPDEALTARLQASLSTLAIRPSDPAALSELNRVLDEAMDQANQLLDRGDIATARDMVNTISQVDPSYAGLPAAWERLTDAERAASPTAYRDQELTGQKLGTVASSTPFALPNAAQAERLEQLLSMVAARPGYQPALTELNALLDDLLVQAQEAMDSGDFQTAEQIQQVVRSVNPRKRGLSESRNRLSVTKEVQEWLALARTAERDGRLVEPLLESAYYYYRKVLTVDQANREALQGLQDIQQVMVSYAMDAAQNYDFELADAWLTEAETIRDDQSAVQEGRRWISEFRSQTAQGIEEEILTAIRAGDYNLAEFKLIDLIALGGYEDRVQALREMMTREESYGSYEPGQVIQERFSDGRAYAPPVVVVSSGSFLMGSPEDERDRSDNESPQRRVTFARGFALGLHEVTVGQYAAFVQATGYRTEAERSGDGSVWDEDMGQLADRRNINWRLDYRGEEADDNLPVLHVAWTDALAYVEWLSQVTGQRYRLPSEAEFEYALRAGSRTVYWWGDSRPRELVENLAGEDDESPGGRKFSNYVRNYGDGHFGPAPVGSFMPNAFGIYDLAGNVSEWVQDCWHSSYTRAPANGLPWENPGCTRRVVRGGYWASAPKQNRSASRLSAPATLKAPQLGFRVARDLF